MADKILYRTDGTIFAGGDIKWLYCGISNHKTRGTDEKNAINILALVAEINLYEDILSHTLYGHVAMVDTHNLINEFPFIGMETLYLGFVTPHVTNAITRVFKIFKISDHHIDGNKQTYKLHFVSVDAWSDVRYSVNKKYQGTSGTIIKQILSQVHNWDDFYSVTGYSKPDLTNIDTDQANQVKFIAPQWSPIKCIKWLEKNALTKSGSYADYLFFDTSAGYKFKSLTQLLKQDPIELLINDNSYPSGNPAEQLTKVLDFRDNQINDNLTRFLNRAYGGKIYNCDVFGKRISNSVWNYSKTYEYNFQSVPNFSGTNESEFLPQSPNFNMSDDHIVSYNNLSSRWSLDLTTPEYENQSNLTRAPAINFLELDKATIDIWGRTYLKVGDSIQIVMGKNKQSKDAEIDGIDKSNTSIWLITAIHHRLAPNQHKMTLQVVRNSTFAPKGI